MYEASREMVRGIGVLCRSVYSIVRRCSHILLMTILKEEINDSMTAILSLAKWKLVVVGALAAVGLGVHKDMGTFEHGYLLLFLSPLVCAYIDFLAYERVAGIHFIAKYLREYSGTDEEMLELKGYEQFIHSCRSDRLYRSYEGTARFVSSVVVSIAVPAFAFAIDNYRSVILERIWLMVLPLAGIVFCIVAYSYHQRQLKKLEG